MKIALVGASGHMGRWFTKYLHSRGHRLKLFDIDSAASKIVSKKIKESFVDELEEAVCDADVTLVSVPIQTMPKVLKSVESYMKEGSTIIEIASIKNESLNVLKTISRIGKVIPISIHPLFGPGATTIEGKMIALIPVNNSSIERRKIKNLFPDARITLVDGKEHDEAMAFILSLTYFINTVFSALMSKTDLAILKKLAGPTFTIQMTLAESILKDEPNLITSLQIDNQYASGIIEEFMSQGRTIADFVKEKDRESIGRLISRTRNILNKDHEFQKSDRKKYDIFEKLLG